MSSLKQRGDTIVEVMIVLAILGLAISICYATANRSLINTRQAHENSEATELVRAQLEALSTVACSSSEPSCSRPAIIDQPNTEFCFKKDGSVYTPVAYTPEDCDNGIYRIRVTLTDKNISALSAEPTTYTLRADWNSLQGEDNDSVTLSYRLP